MMHTSMILDPDTSMYDAHIYDPQSLTLMHVCMMHLSMILNHACMYGACIYDAANFVTDGRTNKRTNEQGDSRSWMQTINFQKEYDGIDLVVHLQIMSVGNSSFSNAYRRHHYLFSEVDLATLISRYTSKSFSQAQSYI